MSVRCSASGLGRGRARARVPLSALSLPKPLSCLTRPKLIGPSPSHPPPYPHRPFSASTGPHHPLVSPALSEAEGPSTLISQLADYFLSQPLAPLSYTLSTVLLTILVRATTTLPVSLWARRRINRFESAVLPCFRAFRSSLAKRAKRSFLHPAEMPVYKAHLQRTLKAELDRLQAVHRCRPAVTIVGSLAVHVPVIYTLTSVLREACTRAQPGSAIAFEHSLTTPSLLEPDLGLALACWAAFLANIELNGTVRQARRAASESDPKTLQQPNSFIGRGLAFWTPEKIRTASFVAGIAMMGISAGQPSLVLVYWLTSNSFSILQNMVFIFYLDRNQIHSQQQQSTTTTTTTGSVSVPELTNEPCTIKKSKSALKNLSPIK